MIISEMPCEMCDGLNGIRRKRDNLYVCYKCNEKYPVKEKNEGIGKVKNT